MRYVILGTAGHIDHGKSTLVHALTGIDPDRLKEEKERGITIDLGFADLLYPDGLAIGIVDVPGHERLVKNMLAGAGGIDIVLMVIAADEGIMPQSREHLHICNLLRIKSGLIAITKSDMVEPDWLSLVTDEVREFVKGSFLDGAPIVPVSSKTGDNIDALKATIHDIAMKVEPKPTKGLFRLPIDRVFTLKGFGSVVTGSVVSGTVGIEDQVEILPSQLKSRVRGLQSHGKPVDRLHAGQRGAINLQSIEKEELRRGDTIVSQGRFTPTHHLDVKLELLESSPEVKNRSLVHFHLGTSETVARVVIYGADKALGGEEAFCQLRLQEPVVAQAGDRYVIRRFSPLETMGGGVVLDPSPQKRRRRDGIDDLVTFEKGTLKERIEAKVMKSRMNGIGVDALEGWVRAEVPEINSAIEQLVSAGRLLRVNEMLYHQDAFAQFSGELARMVDAYHKQHPLKKGMPKEEARVRLKAEYRSFSSLLDMVKEVVADADILMLKGFNASVSDEQGGRIIKLLDEKGCQPPSTEELAETLSVKPKQLLDMLKLMHKDGSIVKISETYFISRRTYEGMISALKSHFAKKDNMSVAEFRDLLGTTRKYALPFLEYLDSNKITLRVDDVRKLLIK